MTKQKSYRKRDAQCIACGEATSSHTDVPLCLPCFRWLQARCCPARGLTAGCRDALAALARLRGHLGIQGPAPTTAVFQWLLLYLPYRAEYLRRHNGRPPTTGRERGIYSTERLRTRAGCD